MGRRIPREIRTCACGCGESIECRVDAGKKYIYGHANNKIKTEKRKCICGCDREFICKINSKQRFISGHNAKFLEFSKETRQKLSNSRKGKILSAETRDKISKKLTGKPSYTRTTLTNFKSSIIKRGKKLSAETKQEISNSLRGKKVWNKGLNKYNDKRLKKMSDDCIYRVYTKKNWAQDTKPELKMKAILEDLKYKFIHPCPIFIEHRYSADFYIPKINTVIEVDGKYWHNYPEGTNIDHTRTKEMQQKGYTVLRFWDGEFDIDNVKNSLEQIKEVSHV